jgi:two-component system sensor histidine kinase KdpD
MRRDRWLRVAGTVGAAALAVGLATGVVASLESSLGVPNASNVYLVAVVAIAIVFGTGGAIATALGSVLLYDIFFTEPRFALAVADPDEWLHLVLLLFVAVTVGQLAALQRARAEAAIHRAHEARTLFDVTRTIATRDSTLEVLPLIGDALRREGGFARVWFVLGADDAEPGRGYAVLHRPDAESGAWTQVRPAAGPPSRHHAAGGRLVRVRMEQSGRPIGSLWAEAGPGEGLPDLPTTTLLRVAADLVAQALGHDRLEAETRRAEVAQQSDTLKSALLESVSHDLRTPLASIRANAGTLMDPEVTLPPTEVRASAGAIDREAQRLNRLVGNLLDLSRIEAGALRTADEALDLEDVVSRAISLVAGRSGVRRIEVDLVDERAIQADPILLEEALVNLLDNAVRHTPEGAAIRVSSVAGPEGLVRLTVEDAGPGVPDAALPRIFDRFFRTSGGERAPSTGMGIGLAVVRGFVEAMGGRVAARRGTMGGLAIDVDLPAAAVPAAPVEVEARP